MTTTEEIQAWLSSPAGQSWQTKNYERQWTWTTTGGVSQRYVCGMFGLKNTETVNGTWRWHPSRPANWPYWENPSYDPTPPERV